MMMMMMMMITAPGQCPLVLLLSLRCRQFRAVQIKGDKVKGDKCFKCWEGSIQRC